MTSTLITRPTSQSIRRLYFLLVILFLIVSCNLGLVNRRAAIQGASGDNILGLRDVLQVLVVLFGLGLLRRRRLAKNALAKIAFSFLCLTPVAACIGLAFGAQPGAILVDGFTMSTWVVALLLGSYFQDRDRLLQIRIALVAVGVAVSVGVLVEIASSGTLAVVTPATTVLSDTGRPTPTGWPTMMMAYSCLLVMTLRQLPGSRAAVFLAIAGLVTISIASLLTQSRTLLVGIIVTTVTFLAISAVFAPRRTRWPCVALLGGCVFLIIPITVYAGSRWVGSDFGNMFQSRYAVLYSARDAEDHLDNEGRWAELQVIFLERFPESPVFGFGLATYYMPAKAKPNTLVHSAFGYFFLRYGLLGLFLWLLFCGILLLSVARFAQLQDPLAYQGEALSLAMLNLAVCATFGNQFSVSYGVQQAMICLGALIACQQLVKHTLRTPTIPVAHLAPPVC